MTLVTLRRLCMRFEVYLSCLGLVGCRERVLEREAFSFAQVAFPFSLAGCGWAGFGSGLGLQPVN